MLMKLLIKKLRCRKCLYALGEMKFIICPCFQCKASSRINKTLGLGNESIEIQVENSKVNRKMRRRTSNNEDKGNKGTD